MTDSALTGRISLDDTALVMLRDGTVLPRYRAAPMLQKTFRGSAHAHWVSLIVFGRTSPDKKLPSKSRFKASRRVPLRNGQLECRLIRFDLVAGSARCEAAPDQTQTR